MLEIGAQLNSMDQLKRTVVAILQRLGGLAPAAIEDRVGGGYARRRRRTLVAHDADQDVKRGAGVGPRQ